MQYFHDFHRPFLVFWDKFSRSFTLAAHSLWLHRLRAFLSVLGIIIGTAAVISLMAFGEGSMQDALQDIERQGATNIIIRSVKPPDDSSSTRRTRVATYGLTFHDYESFQLIESVTRHVPMRIFPQEIRRNELMHNGRVVATNAKYPDVTKIEMLQGRFLIEKDELEMADVVVIGTSVAQTLFPFEDAINKNIVLNKHDYTVVGIMTERAPTGGNGPDNQGAENFNSDVYIPITTCRGRFGEKIFIRTSGSFSGEQVELHQVTLTISDMEKVPDAGKAVRSYMEDSHQKMDWEITVPLDRLLLARSARDRGKVLLALIASISLLVGGIGIMNIMLATVTERTREIGIRRALGAKRRDITLQFLVEAMVQTSMGGLFGVAVGMAIVFGVPGIAALFGKHLPAQLHVPSIFFSLLVSICVGVIFGLYPAFRASRLDPIEALRHQ